MRARSTRLAASVRERAIDVSLAKSSSPSDSSIARRHATMTFDLLARIKSHFTSHRSSDESHPTDPFLGIDELVETMFGKRRLQQLCSPDARARLICHDGGHQ